MGGYASACQEKDWFFEIELIPVFFSVAWELLRAGRNQVSEHKLEDHVQLEYENQLDRILLTKGMWDASGATFKDDTVKSKVYQALHKTYDTALDEAVTSPHRTPDEVR